MPHAPSSPDLSTQSAQPTAADDAEDMVYFKRVLRHLIEIGDDLAAMVHEEAAQAVQAQRDANAQNPNPPPLVVPREIKESYERITRSVRRSLVLYLKLNEPPKQTTAPTTPDPRSSPALFAGEGDRAKRGGGGRTPKKPNPGVSGIESRLPPTWGCGTPL